MGRPRSGSVEPVTTPPGGERTSRTSACSLPWPSPPPAHRQAGHSASEAQGEGADRSTPRHARLLAGHGGPYNDLHDDPERCQSGRSGRSRKPVSGQPDRGFESLPLRYAKRTCGDSRRRSYLVFLSCARPSAWAAGNDRAAGAGRLNRRPTGHSSSRACFQGAAPSTRPLPKRQIRIPSPPPHAPHRRESSDNPVWPFAVLCRPSGRYGLYRVPGFWP